MTTAALGDITPAQWEALAARRVFFGHQSVGRDLMQGLERLLAAQPHIPVRLVSTDDPGSVAGPAFIEASIGRNLFPDTKSDAFRQIIDEQLGAEPGSIAMYKFCYVDFLPETDPEAFFEDYVQRMEALRARHPELTLVHFTVPLRTVSAGMLESLKTRLGRPTQTVLNAKREQFNELLRQRYVGREPVFDLALLQSTRADGSRAYVSYRGRQVRMLAPEWTYDGGHLTEPAQDRMAERLLVFLAQLPPVPAPAAPAAPASALSD